MISIIIPYYNGRNFIQNCLEKLYQNTRNDFEVIISSDGYDDMELLQDLKNKYYFKLLFGERVGFGRNCNRAFEHSRGKIITFLNQDLMVEENWDDPILEILKTKIVGAVGAKLIYPNRKIQHCGVAFSPMLDPIHIYKNYPENFPPAQKEREFQTLTGALLGIRREVFEIFKFSDEYFFYYEDTDLCFSLRANKLKVIYTPNSKAIHIESSSEKPEYLSKNLKKSKEIFLKKWKEYIIPDELEIYLKDRQLYLFLKKTAKYIRKRAKSNLIKFLNLKN